MKNSIFIFFGAPGAGKGSLSKLCVNEFGWTQLSTGNLCRKHIEDQTEIGKKIDFDTKSGKLISDSLISEMVEDWLINGQDGHQLILDGYPRTLGQAEFLHDLLRNKLSHYDLKIIKLDVSEQILISRLVNRLVCSNKKCQAVYSSLENSSLIPKDIKLCDNCSSLLIKRNDDSEEVVRERLEIYNKNEKDLISFYNSLNINLIKLDVDKPINEVFEDFRKIVSP
ncbi:MAG: nucleoside monophosphate kinase [Candidatus Babeliales bacterium]|nr:nucleoside monophosphate kinase [Candidatus Babeliales bacterium]